MAKPIIIDFMLQMFYAEFNIISTTGIQYMISTNWPQLKVLNLSKNNMIKILIISEIKVFNI
jgi:hypothetical protein